MKRESHTVKAEAQSNKRPAANFFAGAREELRADGSLVVRQRLLLPVLSGLWLIMFVFVTLMAAREDQTNGLTIADLILLVLTLSVALMLAAGVILPLRSRVIANAQALRWRTWRGWRSLRWDEVTDYYDELAPARSLVVSGRGDKMKLSSGIWGDLSQLRCVVSERAYAANTRKWGVLGIREQDPWPRVFEYEPRARILFGKLTMLAIGVGMFAALLPNYEESDPSTIGGLMLVAAYLVFGGVTVLREPFRVWRGKGIRVVATPEGVTMIRRDARQFIAWGEVTHFYIAASRFRPRAHMIESPTTRIEIPDEVANLPLLRRLVQVQTAGNKQDADWETRPAPKTLIRRQ